MRVDLQRTDSWDAINLAYRKALQLTESALQVQTYPGVKAALWEVCTQLTQLVPNKRTIYYQKEAEPVFESVAVHLSREGFKLKALTAAELNKPAEWFEAVQKDLLFIVELQDEPVTAELYDFPELDTALAEKRVYRVSVSHSRHTCLPMTPPMPYRANVFSLGLDSAVAVLGERVRVQPPVASGMIWPELTPEAALDSLGLTEKNKYETMKAKVIQFEKTLPEKSKAVLKAGTPRLFDRALFSFSDLDGLSFITELSKEIGIELKPPGERGALETTSLCRWQDERVWKGLLDRGFQAEQLRGLIAVSGNAITDELSQKISKARSRVLSLQNG